MKTYYQVKVKYTKEFTDGTLKRVTEPYMVNAVSFTDAEAIIHKEVGEFIRGEFAITAAAKQDIHEVINHDDSNTWWKVKVIVPIEDSDSGKVKNVANTVYVTAESNKDASERVIENFKDSMFIFEITQITKTKIVEFIDVVIEPNVEPNTEEPC